MTRVSRRVNLNRRGAFGLAIWGDLYFITFSGDGGSDRCIRIFHGQPKTPNAKKPNSRKSGRIGFCLGNRFPGRVRVILFAALLCDFPRRSQFFGVVLGKKNVEPKIADTER